LAGVDFASAEAAEAREAEDLDACAALALEAAMLISSGGIGGAMIAIDGVTAAST
jgi:hypothetical protein